jgi:hypothetical protein
MIRYFHGILYSKFLHSWILLFRLFICSAIVFGLEFINII